MFKLTHKTAVVTGGGSGIGAAISQLFARQGAAIHLLDFDPDTAAQTADSIRAEGGDAYVHPCDVANARQVAHTIQKIRRVDILVNNAGIAHVGKLHQTSEADFERVLSVNVKGVFNALSAAVPLMQAQGGGVILNLSSIAALVGIPDRFAYSMSKGAVQAMTLSVARDYLADHIRCNCISPARVHTPFVDGFISRNYPGQEAEIFDKLAKSQPIGRMGRPEEVAALALYLCSDEAAFITGCDYPIDGGFVRLRVCFEI
jgi:2-keto-3-deoxy-L-fuconate dehydrogenase